MDASTLALGHGPSPAGGQPQHTGRGSPARAPASGGCAWARRRVARAPGSGGKCRSAPASGTAATMAAGQRGDDGGDGSSRRSRKRTERANYSSFEVQESTSSDSWSASSVSSSSSAGSSNSTSSASSTSTSTIADADSSATERRNSSNSSSNSSSRRSSAGDGKVRNLDRLQRKWRDTVQKQQEMRRRASEVEKRYNLDDDSASAAAKDWEDVEDPRKTNSMRARSLRISAKLRQSLARRRRRPTSAPEGKEKRKLMVRFADQVTVRSYEVPQEEEEDVEEEQQDDAASYSLNGEKVLGGPKSPGMSRGHAMMAQQACVVDGDEFGSVVPDETCALSDRARDLSKKQRRRPKRRNKNSKRVRSPEYTREAEFFDMIQDWCRRELTDVSYEGASIQEFLPRKRASVARDHHIETYAELVRKCKRFVDNEIYEPSSLEQDSSTFAIHTEEIIASLVRDCLESFLSYRVDKIPREADALCHDCFYIARDLVLARRALLDNTLTSTQA